MTTMESLITAFELKPSELFTIMTRYGCFIAGGAATHALCERSTPFTGDLDIWYPGTPQREKFTADRMPADIEDQIMLRKNKKALTDFLLAQGYTVDRVTTSSSHEDMKKNIGKTPSGAEFEENGYQTVFKQYVPCLVATGRGVATKMVCLYGDSPLGAHLREVWTFKKGSKQVQIIYAYDGRDDILKRFDFSFCAVGHDPSTGQFFGPELELTKTGKGYLMNADPERPNVMARRKKYEERGFTLTDRDSTVTVCEAEDPMEVASKRMDIAYRAVRDAAEALVTAAKQACVAASARVEHANAEQERAAHTLSLAKMRAAEANAEQERASQTLHCATERAEKACAEQVTASQVLKSASDEYDVMCTCLQTLSSTATATATVAAAAAAGGN